MATLRQVDKVIRVFYSKAGHTDKNEIFLACNFLNNNGVIAVPTDTLYGITARVDDSLALERIYKIKGRDPNKPLAICISKLEQIDQVAEVLPKNRQVLPYLLPGPLTIVLKRSPNLNKDLNPNTNSIGVRLPDHNFIREISETLGCPLALTSANRSGEVSPTTIDDFKEIWDDLDAVFDLGNIKTNITPQSPLAIRMRAGSTVLDLTEERSYKILREGCGLNRTLNVLNRSGFKRRT